MSVVAVRHHLNVHGTIPRGAEIPNKGHTALDCEEVHAVNTNPRDVIAHLVVVRVGRVAVNGGTHAIVVVLDAEDHGELPERRHVGRLPDLPLIRGTVTITRDCNIHVLPRLGVVLISEGESHADRDLRPDNTGSTPEVVLLVIEVHRPALRLGHSLDHAKELADDRPNGAAPRQGLTVAAVRCDPVILGRESGIDASGHGLLSVVQVAETTDVARLVLIVACDLHSAHGVHKLEVLHELVLRHVDGVLGLGFQVVDLERTRKVEGRAGVIGRHEPRRGRAGGRGLPRKGG
mmetsp:Transcript_16608/g.34045  ORF Transcript_16608/g.34045 Transcript_16608/m.34045 type:complete len:291 (-) Transcript_16608:66-938(-)